MLRSLFTSAGVLAFALTLGCGEQPLATESVNTQTPALRTAVSPVGRGGAVVIRVEGGIAYGLWDEERSFLVGLSLPELASLCETGEVTYDRVTVLEVLRPDGSTHTMLHAKNPSVLVWDQPFIFDPCSAPPFASGTGQFSYTDNFPIFSDNVHRAYIVGFRLQGRVTGIEDGQLYKLSATGHAVGNSQQPLSEEIEVRLSPIGK
jgi:hypothetical protein